MDWKALFCCCKKEEETTATAPEASQSVPIATTPEEVPIAVQPPPPTQPTVPPEPSASSSVPTPSSEAETVTQRQLAEHVIPEHLNIVTPEGTSKPTRAKVAEGGGKIGTLELAPEAYIIKGLSDEHARKARKSMKKDKAGADFDSKRKEYVYDYLNTEGGWIIDPADKKKHVRVEPGTLV